MSGAFPRPALHPSDPTRQDRDEHDVQYDRREVLADPGQADEGMAGAEQNAHPNQAADDVIVKEAPYMAFSPAPQQKEQACARPARSSPARWSCVRGGRKTARTLQIFRLHETDVASVQHVFAHRAADREIEGVAGNRATTSAKARTGSEKVHLAARAPATNSSESPGRKGRTTTPVSTKMKGNITAYTIAPWLAARGARWVSR